MCFQQFKHYRMGVLCQIKIKPLLLSRDSVIDVKNGGAGSGSGDGSAVQVEINFAIEWSHKPDSKWLKATVIVDRECALMIRGRKRLNSCYIFTVGSVRPQRLLAVFSPSNRLDGFNSQKRPPKKPLWHGKQQTVVLATLDGKLCVSTAVVHIITTTITFHLQKLTKTKE